MFCVNKIIIYLCDTLQGIIIATSASVRNGKVGAGGAIIDTKKGVTMGQCVTYLRMLGPRKEQNPYTAKLSAISQALRCLPDHIHRQNIYIITQDLSAIQRLMQPKQQSGQTNIKAIYQAAEKLLQRGNQIQCIWLPTKVTSQQQTAA